MPGKTVRFNTPSPAYSVSSLPETDGSLSPPPIANAMLPAVDGQLCPVLHYSRSTPCPVAWDMSFPVETARLHPAYNQSYWSASATNPPVAHLSIIYGTWRITIVPATRLPYVTVLDILQGLYRFLRGTSSERDFKSLSPDKQRRVENAYNQRWQRCLVPAEREMERMKGVKHIDFLADSRYFWGLTPTKELGVWQLQVTRS
ncbi:hypothetical protein D9757_002120 [Collybiopsis confluens]|uniref:DUF6699 domain-containing protein n=1 Tax=Collybiopsis confluens TaxID=2823264 RepID=A0A8H5I085_9AGAR|nr:hypothetical protein D9757_002120 [Collybiopsis confluens]